MTVHKGLCQERWFVNWILEDSMQIIATLCTVQVLDTVYLLCLHISKDDISAVHHYTSGLLNHTVFIWVLYTLFQSLNIL